MSIGTIISANARRLLEATNGLLKESIQAIPLQEEAPNTYPNQKEVSTSQEDKTAYFMLEVKGCNEGQMCTF